MSLFVCRRPIIQHLFRLKIELIRHNSNVIRSPFPDLVIPDVTLPELIFTKLPEKTAVECVETGRKYSYEQLRKKCFNLSKALKKVTKLNSGDTIAIILLNIPEYPICVLGSLLANLRVTTINPFGTANDISNQILDSQAKAIFTISKFENDIRRISKNLQISIPIITIKTKFTDTTSPGFINFDELVDNNFDISCERCGKVDDIAIIPYSSGTSGNSKGVLHSHKTLVAAALQVCSPKLSLIKPATETCQEICVGLLPFFHIYGLNCCLIGPLVNKGKVVTVSKYTNEILLRILKIHKPRMLCLVPPLALFLINSPLVTRKHLESTDYVLSAASPLGIADEERFLQKSGGKTKLVQCYGMTESPCISFNLNNHHSKLSSVGPLLQNTEIKIVPINNPFAESLGKLQKGEILVRGPQVMLGYNNKPKQTEEMFVNGWLRTGDLGHYDEHGNLYIKDRVKELIKVKGFQVPPAELEELIRKYPNVSDAVVVGIPHEKYGEVPRAFITLTSGSTIDLEDLNTFVTNNVSSYKRIQGGFQIVDSIPKSGAGKYIRRHLKTQYLSTL